MKAHLMAALLLLGISTAASAQNDTLFRKSFSLEVGTGLCPLHMLGAASAAQSALASQGQDVNRNGAFYPVFSLTGVLRTGPKTEHKLTGGVSWYQHRVIQYPAFGTDPKGDPRYDLSDGSPAGWKASSPIFTLTWNWRYVWLPAGDVELYSGFGAGIAIGKTPIPLPSITPIAFRFGGTRFYGFAECTMGPVASIVHFGMGWRL